MAERLPPDDGDDLFEWTDAPARPPRPEPLEREADYGDTGQRPAPGGAPSQAPAPPPPETGERDPFATGERAPVADQPRGRRSDTEERRRHRGDTGEFERSGRKPPAGRRYRHRDLPANVRRRQAIVVGGIALLVIIG